MPHLSEKARLARFQTHVEILNEIQNEISSRLDLVHVESRLDLVSLMSNLVSSRSRSAHVEPRDLRDLVSRDLVARDFIPTPSAAPVCYYCRQAGHIRKNCPELAKRVCFECGIAGHTRKYCKAKVTEA